MPVRSATMAAISCLVRLTVCCARRAASWPRTSVRSSSRRAAAFSYCGVRHGLLELLLEPLAALGILGRLRPAEPDVGRALVKQVDGLVGQEAVGQVAAWRSSTAASMASCVMRMR